MLRGLRGCSREAAGFVAAYRAFSSSSVLRQHERPATLKAPRPEEAGIDMLATKLLQLCGFDESEDFMLRGESIKFMLAGATVTSKADAYVASRIGDSSQVVLIWENKLGTSNNAVTQGRRAPIDPEQVRAVCEDGVIPNPILQFYNNDSDANGRECSIFKVVWPDTRRLFPLLERAAVVGYVFSFFLSFSVRRRSSRFTISFASPWMAMKPSPCPCPAPFFASRSS